PGRYRLCRPRPAGRRIEGGGLTALRRFLRSPEGAFGVGILALLVAVAVLAPVFFPRDPLSIVASPLLPPFADATAPLGTDRLGRDVLAELMHGARASLAVGIAAAAVALIIGTLVGTLAGFLGGLVDEALM